MGNENHRFMIKAIISSIVFSMDDGRFLRNGYGVRNKTSHMERRDLAIWPGRRA